MKKVITVIIILNVVIFGQVNGFIPVINSRGTKTVSASSQGVPAVTSLNPSTTTSNNSTVQDINKDIPSVVTIRATQTQNLPSSYIQQLPGRQSQASQNIGSGFVVASNGYIVTNKHVASLPGVSYDVVTSDNKVYPVTNIVLDPNNDLAILKINATGLTPIPLGNSSSLELGQAVYAVGTPLGQFSDTVTNGIISGLDRTITAGTPYSGQSETLNGVIQTSAAINPGNSGGPLINIVGQVIGINTAAVSGGQNIGFAIPVNVITSFLASQGIS